MPLTSDGAHARRAMFRKAARSAHDGAACCVQGYAPTLSMLDFSYTSNVPRKWWPTAAFLSQWMEELHEPRDAKPAPVRERHTADSPGADPRAWHHVSDPKHAPNIIAAIDTAMRLIPKGYFSEIRRPQEKLRCAEPGCGRFLAYTDVWLDALFQHHLGPTDSLRNDIDVATLDEAIDGESSRGQWIDFLTGLSWRPCRVNWSKDVAARLVKAMGGPLHLVVAVQTLTVIVEHERREFLAAIADNMVPGGLFVAVHEPNDKVTDPKNAGYDVRPFPIERLQDVARSVGLLHQWGVVAPSHYATATPYDDQFLGAFLFLKTRDRRLYPAG